MRTGSSGCSREARDAEPGATRRLCSTRRSRSGTVPRSPTWTRRSSRGCEAGRLEELRVVALEERIEAELALGRHAALVGELEALVADAPAPRAAARPADARALSLRPPGERRSRSTAPPGSRSPTSSASTRRRSCRSWSAGSCARIPTSRHRPRRRRRPPRPRPSGASSACSPPSRPSTTTRRRCGAGSTRCCHEFATCSARYDGELERFGPEGLVAVFGADAPRDDDALRAVRAAAELGLPAGIATGESVGGAGAVFTRAVELARGGGLQVDERTRALVQHERRLDAPLVGRTEELATPARRIRRGASGATLPCRHRPRRARDRQDPARPRARRPRSPARRRHSSAAASPTARGRRSCRSLDALRELDGRARSLPTPTASWPRPASPRSRSAQDAGTLGESYWAVRRLLEALARTRPVLLLLDDVHWAEPALLDLVDYLAERVTDAPLLVVSLARPELARPAGEQIAARAALRRRGAAARGRPRRARRGDAGARRRARRGERALRRAARRLRSRGRRGPAADARGGPRRADRPTRRPGADACFSAPPSPDASSPAASSPRSPTSRSTQRSPPSRAAASSTRPRPPSPATTATASTTSSSATPPTRP